MVKHLRRYECMKLTLTVKDTVYHGYVEVEPILIERKLGGIAFEKKYYFNTGYSRIPISANRKNRVVFRDGGLVQRM